MRVQRRLFPLLCAVLLLAALLSPAAAARRFSMSYVYFGSPSSYVEQVDGTQGSQSVSTAFVQWIFYITADYGKN